jgi:hypothetical protein
MALMKAIEKKKRTKKPGKDLPAKRKRVLKNVGTQTESLENILKMMQNNIKAMKNVLKKNIQFK